MSEGKSKSSLAMIAMILFGIVQIFQALSVILRGKLASVYLGMEGYGRYSLYLSIIVNIQVILLFGINSSVSRELSVAKSEANHDRIKLILGAFTIFVKLILILLLIVTLLVLFYNYFILEIELSVYLTLIFSAFFVLLFTSAQSIAQGLGDTKLIMRASIISSCLTIVFSFILFRCLGSNSLNWVILSSTFLSFITYYGLKRELSFSRINMSRHIVLKQIRAMMSYGLTMLTSSIVGVGSLLLINIYLLSFGDFKDLGLYQAAVTIITSSLALVYSALNFVYLPKLTGVHENVWESNDLINDYTELSILIAAPILMTFFVFSKTLIFIFFSADFVVVSTFIKYVCIGSFFQVAQQTLAYLPIAKGDKNMILKYSFIGNIALIISVIIGYSIWGLQGVGVFFIIQAVGVFSWVYITSVTKYGFVINHNINRLYLKSIVVICVFSFINWKFSEGIVLKAFYSFIIVLLFRRLISFVSINDLVEKFKNKRSV